MSRTLTVNETALAKEVFKDSLDYEQVKIHQSKYIFFQSNKVLMTPNGEIYAPEAVYKPDYSAEDFVWSELFIHEMAHVWQYQTGILNPRFAGIFEFVKNGFDYHKAYSYVLESGKDLIDYGMEQQAAIIADYFLVVASGQGFGRHNANKESLEERKELLTEVLAKFIANPSYVKN